MPPTVPFNHYQPSQTNHRRLDRPPLLHALLFRPKGRFEHSNLFKLVSHLGQSTRLSATTLSNAIQMSQALSRIGPRLYRNTRNRSNYELFKRSNFCICLWRLVLPRLLAPDLPSTRSSMRDVKSLSFQSQIRKDSYCYFSSLPPRTEIG